MRAGGLDRRVLIERRTRVQGPTGELIETWEPLGHLWAGKRDIRAAERWGADQVIAENATAWMLRWWPAWEEIRADTHRLVYRGRVFEIHGVREVGRRDGVEIATAARGEDGYMMTGGN